MADSGPAAEPPGAGEAPWPVLQRPSGAQPPPPPPDVSGEGGGGRGAFLRVAALVGLLAVVTAAGIAIGRAVQPSHPHVTTTIAASTSATPPPPKPPRPAHRVTFAWGPLE